MVKPKCQRVVLKLSGEALVGEDGFGIKPPVIKEIIQEIKEAHELGIEMAIVVGGGNTWRGRTGAQMDMERTQADYVGMLATVMNTLVLQDALENLGVPTRVQTSIEVRQIAEPYIRRRAERHLEKGHVVIFAGGMGNPYFSTDTTAALRTAEADADVILMAKNNVDGIYSADLRVDETVTKSEELTHLDVISKGLQVMDSIVSSPSMDNDIPSAVFNLNEVGNIRRATLGENIGTTVRGKQRMSKEVLAIAKEKVTEAEESLCRELGQIHAGRASASLLDRIQVEYYGAPTPANQLASINTLEARVLMTTPLDKNSIVDIEKTIQMSDIGISPTNDGNVTRLAIPQLTEERRKELAKDVKKEAEDSKVTVRNVRHDAMDKLKKAQKNGDITEDELRSFEKDVQKLADDSIKNIDAITAEKEQEPLEI